MVQFLEQAGIPHDKIRNPDTTEGSIRWILECLRRTPTDIFVPNVVTSAHYACRWVRQAGICTVGILHSDWSYCDALQTEFLTGAKSYRMTGFVGVSKELERQLQAGATTDTSIYRVPYGAPIPEQHTPPPDEKLRVAYFGRLVTEQKRSQILARTFCRLAREVPGIEAVIYGDGPERKEVETILADQGEGHPVCMGGSIPSNEVQEHMRQCHVIVLLSDYEGLPIALMEAMACGCVPICRYNKSGIPELIQNGVNGYVIDEDDELITAVRELKSQPSLWNRYSQASRELILRDYTMDHGADLWAQCFQDQMQRWRRPGSIKTPRWMRLPPPNPQLGNSGHRERPVQTCLKRSLVRSRMFAGKIKRSILGAKGQSSSTRG